MRFKPPDEKNEAQELLRQEQSRAAPTVGARRTSRAPVGLVAVEAEAGGGFLFISLETAKRAG